MKKNMMVGALSSALATAASLCAFSACGEAGFDGGVGTGGGAPSPTTSGGNVPTAASTGSAPPEQEVESTYGAPVATGKYVWIANPASGRVAYIDATTLEIKLVDAGNAPTYIAAIPGTADDEAIVLNVLSSDATLLRASGNAVSATTVALPSGGNGWAMSPDGHWAIAWTDARHVPSPDPVEGYQDLTVVDLTQGSEASTAISVGYRPVAVAFDESGKHAYAVTQDGVSIVSLIGEPAVIKNVPLSNKAADMATTTDVSITPDGSYALVRRDDQTDLSIFTLADGTRTDVALPFPATDLDLSADGKTAVAVMRDALPESEIALLSIPQIVGDPGGFVIVDADTTLGSASLAPKSAVGFFYTNATPNPVLSVMDTSVALPALTDILMRAPILAVFPTPDGSNALVMHDALTDSGSHYPAAVSLAPIALALPPKIVGLDAPPVSVAMAPAGDRVLVAAGSEQSQVFEAMLGAFPSLEVRKLTLASMPIAAGIVAGAGRGYVAQKHPDGRITFIDFTSGEVRTLTGFELATQVTDGTP